MIEQVDAQLQAWVETILGGAAVRFSPPVPNAGEDGLAVHLYLLRMLPSLPRTALDRKTSEFFLNYLVTVHGDPAQAHAALAELAFAALDTPDFELEFEPPATELWLALGVMPQPALTLRVPLRRERLQPDAPRVRTPVLERAEMTQLQGVVLGPEDIPLSGAQVDLLSLRLHQRTDHHGRFSFTRVPRQPQQLRVRAKGHEMTVAVEPGSPDEPVIVRLNLFDEEG